MRNGQFSGINFLLFWIFWFCKTFPSANGQADGCRMLEFIPVLDGHALVNHVIRNISLERQDACRVACYLDNDCLSYNFGRLQDETSICQLSDSDHIQHPDDLKKSSGFIYRGTENACSKNLCSTHGKCKIDPRDNTYFCQCEDGFVGKYCEEAPNAPPSNVTGQYESSTSILVQWGEVPAANQNGVILSYTVTYRALPDGSNKNKTVSARQATLTGLNEYTNYSITVFASTVKGDGIVSAPIIVITEEGTPDASPSNVTGQYTSSTSILVQWNNVPAADQNGVLLSYTVTYRALPDGSNKNKTVSAPTTQTTLTGLNEYTNYSITVFASTVKGGGIVSAPIIVITDEDTPNAPPSNFQGQYASSTSILVQWGDVPAADQNGIILSYTVTYRALPDGSVKTEVMRAPTTQTTLTGLNEYTNYSITVFASTVKGDGIVSAPIIVITDEDTPNAPPSNVTGQYEGSTSILVQWGEVPAADQNGIILSYTVTYRALPDGGNKNKTVSAHQTTLTALNEYTNYSITVFASTLKGGGIVSTPIIVITNEDIGNAFMFPQNGVSDYVIVNPGMPRLSALTACFWMKSVDKRNKGTLLSYAVPEENNEFLVYNYNSFHLYVGGDSSSYESISATDGVWHHICATWETTTGSWKLYKDGETAAQGQELKKGYVIKGAGTLVLGQDQDSVGGTFQKFQSFIGEMTGVNIWSRVLDGNEIATMAQSFCLAGEGDVYKWSDFKRSRRVGVQFINASCSV